MIYYKTTDACGIVTFHEGDRLPQGGEEYPSHEAWQADVDVARDAALAAPPPVPTWCSKLGLKRALAETGKDAVFEKPEWPAVKDLLAQNADLQEDWDLAVAIHRADPLAQGVIADRGYDAATVEKILVRANVLAS